MHFNIGLGFIIYYKIFGRVGKVSYLFYKSL